jgi:hydroxyacyl-ACP dehydratase HTD2-like protein with hotdog domain
MLQAISGHVAESTAQKMVVESIQYRNLAPLYCDEQMRICGKEKKRTNKGIVYDVWIEGPTGGMAVKGTVRTVEPGVCNEVHQ